jgi:hypothetical protein
MSHYDHPPVLPPDLRIVQTPFVILVYLLLFFREIAVGTGEGFRWRRVRIRWRRQQRRDDDENESFSGRTAGLLQSRIQSDTMIRSCAPDPPLMDGHNLIPILPTDFGIV